MRRKVFFFICAPPLPRLGSAEAAERPKQVTAEPFFRAKTPRQLTSAAAKKDEAAPKLFLRSAARVAPTRRCFGSEIGWSLPRKKVGRQPIGGRRRFPERKTGENVFFLFLNFLSFFLSLRAFLFVVYSGHLSSAVAAGAARCRHRHRCFCCCHLLTAFLTASVRAVE